MKRGIWISLFVLFVYFLSYTGVQHSIDELATISLAESFLRGTFSVNQMEWEQERYPPQNAYGANDNLYSKKGLGITIAILPLFLIGKYWPAMGAVQLAFLTSALITAVTVFIFYLTARSLNYSKSVATIAAVALGLGSLLWPYALMLFSEPIAFLGIALAILGLVDLWQSLSWQEMFLCGVGIAIVILSRSANVILVLPIMAAVAYRIWLVWREQKDWGRILKVGILFALPIGVIVCTIMGYNFVRFGTLLFYPTVPGEAFSTPLWTGVSGQLWSSGKGLVFYMPLTLMVVLSFIVDWHRMKNPIYITAVFIILIPLLFYGRWYDWPGGKAWGPRFLVPTMPALVLLCLPAINWLNVTRPKWRRVLLVVWLLLTFLAQLPGVLVNFEYQEILDGKAGATYQDLLWNWSFSPLITYWNKVFGGAGNPIWLHPFFWENATKLLVFIAILLVIILGIHIGLAWFVWVYPKKETPGAILWLLGALTLIFAGSMVVAAKQDLRWRERTDNYVTNQMVRSFLEEETAPSDLVLLDFQEQYDRPGRFWEWLNEAPIKPDYIGYKRKTELSQIDGGRLQNWMMPYARVWLVLQATPIGAPDSTTENWLYSQAYEGRNLWLDSQRVVEYILPEADGMVMNEGTAVFRTDPPLTLDYTLSTGKTPAHILLDLDWENEAPWLNYSLQLMNREQTELLRQIDKPIAGEGDKRLGIVLDEPNVDLLLRVYDPGSHEIFSIETKDGSVKDYLLLSKSETSDNAN